MWCRDQGPFLGGYGCANGLFRVVFGVRLAPFGALLGAMLGSLRVPGALLGHPSYPGAFEEASKSFSGNLGEIWGKFLGRPLAPFWDHFVAKFPIQIS